MCGWESVQPDPKIVGELVRLIVAAASPLRILLFGSAARGNMHPDSDLDVLVVLAEGVPRRRTCQKIYRHLIGFPAAVDVLVTTEKELSKHQDNFSLIYYPASREGKEIYVAEQCRAVLEGGLSPKILHNRLGKSWNRILLRLNTHS